MQRAGNGNHRAAVITVAAASANEPSRVQQKAGGPRKSAKRAVSFASTGFELALAARIDRSKIAIVGAKFAAQWKCSNRSQTAQLPPQPPSANPPSANPPRPLATTWR